MSIPTLNKNYFLVFARDLPGAVANRTKHNPAHRAYNSPLVKDGYIVAAGGLLTEGANSSDANLHDKRQGSYSIIQADTVEKAWETLKKDPYYTSGEVWDHARITVTPVFHELPKVE